MASLLYGLAVRLVGDLSSPLVKDYVGKPWKLGSKSEFEKIKSSVSAIEAVLLDAEEKQRTNRQVQDWLKKIKLVFYDLEDLLQDVRTEDLKRHVTTKNKKAKKVHIFSKKVQIFPKKVHIFLSLPNQVKFRFKMGRKMKLIRERLDAIASDRNSFSFTFTERKEEIFRRREETHSFVPVHQFIGRHADKESVTKHLLQPDAVDKVSVVSIVGIGGMGKTTLAQSIYDSEEVKCRFDLRMWVCVSVPFDVKLICQNIIESATKAKCERLQMDGVKDELKKAIDGRKYLLVLDDVWNENPFEWGKLESLLSGGGRGSKILITARAELVARAAESIAISALKGLSHDDSWALFKQTAFKRRVEQVSPTMERIGTAIVEKCVGVPLLLKVIGSMLAVKEEDTDWLNFEKNDLPRITQDSEGTVLPTLRLSYDYLSASLKRCFVYCAIYPKDYGVKKEELIGMWMAHGLIQLDSTKRSLEDVGQQHFKDLLDRAFFEEYSYIDHYKDRIVTVCKMHDLIHDLAQSLGENEYYDLVSGANCMVKSIRHAHVSGDKFINISRDGRKLRTLVLTSPCDERKVNELASTFEQLRVLSLRRLWLASVPQYVGGLRHLYYLDLSRNNFVSLPESICSLYNLQTLILRKCDKLEELPAGTRDLVSLRRLDVGGCTSLRHMPRGVEELTCLQTLSEFPAGGERLGKGNCAHACELKSLVNLRGELAIRNLSSFKCAKCETNKSCILMELKLLKQLKLKWISVEEEVEEEDELLLIESLKPHPNLERLIIEDYPVSKFPSWMDRVNIGDSLPNIVYIQLSYCKNWRHLTPLGLLPYLQQLHLKGMASLEYLIDSSSSLEEEADRIFFPSLKELSLSTMHELKGLVEPTEASRTAAAATTATNICSRYFPILEKLEIHGCTLFLADGRKEDGKQFVSLRELCFQNTETPPSWVQYLPHLQTLKLSHSSGLWSLPEWMGNLTSLQELNLHQFSSLSSSPDWMQGLTSLQELLPEHLSPLTRIPDLLHLPSLQRVVETQTQTYASTQTYVSRCEKETGAD